jgi:hypothetical protein
MRPTTKPTLSKKPSILLVLSLLVMSAFAVRAFAMPQPNMEAALGYLQQAKAALEHAEHNKGGFRVKAIGSVDQAIGAVREGIAVGNR